MAGNTTGPKTKLDKPARTDPDGTVHTSGDVVVERIRLGLDYQSASDSAGVSRRTLHTWRLTAARHRASQAQGVTLTDVEQKYVDFLHDLEKAEAEAEANRLSIIQRTAQGGIPVTRTTTKYDADGDMSVQTVVVETTLPVRQAGAWILERRLPGKYARRVEVTGAEGQPLVPPDQQARDLAEQLRVWQAREAAITVTGVDETDGLDELTEGLDELGEVLR